LDRTILAIVLASMAGLPPFAGFYGKMLVWISLIEDIYLFNDSWSYLLLITNLLVSLIMMFYYMQILCTLYINDEHASSNNVAEVGVGQRVTTSIQCIGIILLVLWTILMPSILSIIYNMI
jgi:NADH-quinone oxidoreductase subunit N